MLNDWTRHPPNLRSCVGRVFAFSLEPFFLLGFPDHGINAPLTALRVGHLAASIFTPRGTLARSFVENRPAPTVIMNADRASQLPAFIAFGLRPTIPSGNFG